MRYKKLWSISSTIPFDICILFFCQTAKCTYKVTLRRFRVTIVCRGKAICITYSHCVSTALVVEHANRMRHIMSSSVVCPAVQYYYTLIHKRQNFRNRKLSNIKCRRNCGMWYNLFRIDLMFTEYRTLRHSKFALQ